MSAIAADTRLRGPFALSLLMHAAIAGGVFYLFRAGPPVNLPPVYRVNIIAAPPGPRAIGVVGATPAATPSTTPPVIRETPKVAPATPVKAPSAAPLKATPVPKPAKAPPAAAAPRAGGGPRGGRGTDVATVQTQGPDFPFPGYLNNIVRQIALNFKPKNPNSPLVAEVFFLIHRDGHVSDFRFVNKSGVYAFDLEAQGAVERAATAFGALPAGFREDVLPVVFRFDPQILQ